MDMMDAKKRLAILCMLASLTVSVPTFAAVLAGAPVPPPGGTMPMGMPPGGFNPPDQVTQGTAAVNINKQGYFQDQVYTSTGKDENALRVTGVPVTLDHVTINKTAGASSSTEGGDFYGMNAAFLATDGAKVTIKNSQVSSSAKNGNGLFSYGKGTELDAQNVTIQTTGDNSGGIQTTGGATTRAWNLNIHTTGNSAAAIRSDRGGGTAQVTTENQKLQGAIVVDTISKLDLNLGKGTDFKGTISQVENKTGEATGSIDVKVAKGATWELTGDSTVTTLQNQGKIKKNGYKLTVLSK